MENVMCGIPSKMKEEKYIFKRIGEGRLFF